MADVIQYVSITQDSDEHSPNNSAALTSAISAGSNRIVVAIVNWGYAGPTSTSPSLTVAGQTMTLLGSRVETTDFATSMYYALESTVASMSGTAISLTFSSTTCYTGISVLEMADRDQSVPTLQTDTTVTDNDVGNASMSTVSGAVVFAGCTVYDTTMTAPTGLTGGGSDVEETNTLSHWHSDYAVASGSTINAEYTQSTGLSQAAWVAASWPAAAGAGVPTIFEFAVG